jgi:putative tricarboxylic transport membrane protein
MTAQHQTDHVGSRAGGSPAAPARSLRARLRRIDPELGVSAFLLALGILVLIETTQIAETVTQRGSVGPKAFPTVIGIGLVILAVLHALDVLRGGHGEMEAGEDIELGAPADWKTVGFVIGAFFLNILLIERLGWLLSGALMFVVAARALGARSLLRDVAVGLALSFGSYLLFNDVLGLSLPAGVLEGVLGE